MVMQCGRTWRRVCSEDSDLACCSDAVCREAHVTLCRSKPWTGRPRCRALSNSPWILGAPAWVPPSGEAFERKPRSIVISRENFAMGSVTRLAHPLEDIVPLSTQSARQAAAVVARLRQDGTELEFELEENFAR